MPLLSWEVKLDCGAFINLTLHFYFTTVLANNASDDNEAEENDLNRPAPSRNREPREANTSHGANLPKSKVAQAGKPAGLRKAD